MPFSFRGSLIVTKPGCWAALTIVSKDSEFLETSDISASLSLIRTRLLHVGGGHSTGSVTEMSNGEIGESRELVIGEPAFETGHCDQGMYSAGIGATQENLDQVRAARIPHSMATRQGGIGRLPPLAIHEVTPHAVGLEDLLSESVLGASRAATIAA